MSGYMCWEQLPHLSGTWNAGTITCNATALVIGTDPGGSSMLRVADGVTVSYGTTSSGVLSKTSVGVGRMLVVGSAGNALYIGDIDNQITGTSALIVRTAGVDRWVFNNAGHFLGAADNTYSIGASGSNRPQNVYVGQSVVIGTDPGGSESLRVGGNVRLASNSYLTNGAVVLGAGGTAKILIDGTPDGVLAAAEIGIAENVGNIKMQGRGAAYLSGRSNSVASGATAIIFTATSSSTSIFAMDDGGLATFVGSVKLSTVGSGLFVKEGTNATMGTATLSGGTATVNTTAVTANSRIFLTIQAPGGTVGAVYVSSRTASTSFVITSTSGSDASVVAWLIIEPA
jgi:hypothetical protein